MSVPRALFIRAPSGENGVSTLFRGIESLAPGEILKVTEAGTTSRPYWELPELARAPARSQRDCVEELGELLAEATHMQLMSDVPLGTYNSGGVDSSLVTTWTAEQVGSGRSPTSCWSRVPFGGPIYAPTDCDGWSSSTALGRPTTQN